MTKEQAIADAISWATSGEGSPIVVVLFEGEYSTMDGGLLTVGDASDTVGIALPDGRYFEPVNVEESNGG